MLLALDLIHFVSFGGERIARSERRKKKKGLHDGIPLSSDGENVQFHRLIRQNSSFDLVTLAFSSVMKRAIRAPLQSSWCCLCHFSAIECEC